MKNCIKCGGITDVIDSRSRDDGLFRRRRKCKMCGQRSSTLEIPHSNDPRVVEQIEWVIANIRRIQG